MRLGKLTPLHPGEHVREYAEARGWNVTTLARRLRVTRASASRLLHLHSGISIEMAFELQRVFSRPARFWLTLQLNYDLAQYAARRRRRL